MTKLKSTVNFRPITHLCDEPDEMWVCEASKLSPWLFGKGADIGCGLRTIRVDAIRVDIDPNIKHYLQQILDNKMIDFKLLMK